MIIAHGKLLADATPAELEARSRYHGAVSLTTENPAALRDGLLRIDGVSKVEVDPQDGRLTAFPKSGARLFEKVSEFLRGQNVVFNELQLEQGRLDEVFRQITTKHVAGGQA